MNLVACDWAIFKAFVWRGLGEFIELRITPASSWTARVGLPVVCDQLYRPLEA